MPSPTSTIEQPTFSTQTRLLVVAPHPDDETIATGLLVQQVRAAGGEVKILLLTAGDNNPWPQRWLERRVLIRKTDRQRWGLRRQAEMLQALQCLDIPVQALQAMGWPDLGVGDCLLQAERSATSALAATIGEFRPNLIAMPSLDDRHPDHAAAHVLVRLALAEQAHAPQMLAYLIHGHAPNIRLVEIRGSDEQLQNKLMALAAHRSQMALSGKRMHRLAARPERYAEMPAMPNKPSTALPWQPSAWWQPWLRLSVVSQVGTQTWRWSDAPLQRDDRGVYHLPSLAEADGTLRFARLASDLPSLWIFDHWGWCEL
jgi:N-acetyl-1-D-myo-inositol-2-amino-2-deoxy-alpha-D-glucopyranoside deacetylase